MFPRGEHIDERFLRHLWNRRELRSASLVTSTGDPVQILDAGTLNSDGGPDIRNARIRIGPALFVGDVEIHRNLMEWLQHRHHSDPAYNKVVLHVVLGGDPKRFPTIAQSGRQIPVLLLEPFLKESLLSLWRNTILDERVHRTETIPCYEKNDAIQAEVLSHWVQKLAVERVELKLRKFGERLRELAQERFLFLHEPWRPYGGLRIEGFPEEIPPPLPEPTHKDFSNPGIWEQVLYEGIMDGLGYSKNRDPFVKLARIVTLHLIRTFKFDSDTTVLQSVFFGVAGLLPRVNAMKEKGSRTYVRTLVRSWNQRRKSLPIGRLHPAEWQFFPTRPGNFPSIRIAAAASVVHRILNEKLFREIIQCIKSSPSAGTGHARLRKLLTVSTDEFWSHHYDFDTRAGKTINALGTSRIDDIICNTILPICLLYARMFRDLSVREGATRIFEAFPALGENAITRLMSTQLLKGKLRLDSMSLQQGVIQLYKYYCSEGRCSECEVGKRVFSA